MDISLGSFSIPRIWQYRAIGEFNLLAFNARGKRNKCLGYAEGRWGEARGVSEAFVASSCGTRLTIYFVYFFLANLMPRLMSGIRWSLISKEPNGMASVTTVL